MIRRLLLAAVLLSATSALAADKQWPEYGWPKQPPSWASAHEKYLYRERMIRTGISHIGNMDKSAFRAKYGNQAYYLWLQTGQAPWGR